MSLELSCLDKVWILKDSDIEAVRLLSEKLDISPVTATVLVNRGVKNVSEAEAFLNPSLSSISAPDLLPHAAMAAEIVGEAVVNKKRIVIYGDYDVDGITGTALLFSFLKNIAGDVAFYIPNRLKEGYGLNQDAIKHLKSQSAELIVTVDCGISNLNEVALAAQLGIQVIITDHHEPPPELPSASAIVNPKLKNSRFPFRELSGVGVAFYLAVAVRKYLRERGYIREGFPKMKDYLDLVAIGTICDVVPLLGENRIFSRIGLELLSNSRRPGIIALKKVSNINNEVTCSDVAFRMGPRINAGGRVSSPETGFKLLLEDDMAKAEELAEALNSENLKRQSLEEKMLANVQNIIDSGDILKEKKSIVLSSEEWHPGIMGIVASRLVDRYFRPVALISVQDGIGRGSARSIPAFNINEALEECRGFLEGFGGHRYAAGFRIKKEMIAPFSEAFEKTVLSRLSETDFFQKQYVDREITMKDIDEKLLKELQQLKPFGMGNREPTFLMRSLNILSLRTAGNKHLMLKLSDGRTDMDAVGFRMGDLNLSMKNHIHALFYPEIHEWNGNRILRMRLEDIKAV